MDPAIRSTLVTLTDVLSSRLTRAAATVEPAVTPAQLGVVAHLSLYGPTTVSALAEISAVAVSTVTRWADRLEGTGLMVRQPAPDNRRETMLVLTARGRALAARWDQARVDVIADLLTPVGPAARDELYRALSTVDPTALMGAAAGVGDQPDLHSEPSRRPDAAVTAWELVAAVSAASPDDAPDVLVDTVRRLTGGAEVVLRVLTLDGRFVRVVAWAAAPAGEDAGTEHPHDENVDRAAVGDAVRTQAVVTETVGERRWTHLPVSTRAARVGVLSVASGGVPGIPTTVLEAVTRTAGLVLEDATSGNRRMRLITRSRAWTVAAEVQSRQLGPQRVVGHGVHAAARIEPAYDGCTDCHDIEMVTTLEGLAIDVAVLDARVVRADAPMVTGLGLGALRHARASGLAPVEQAALVDEAVFGHFKGNATLDFLLLRLQIEPRRLTVLATSGMTLFRQNRNLVRHDLVEQDAAGRTGDTPYRSQTMSVRPSERIVVVGDGFSRHSPAGRRAQLIIERSVDVDPDEVVRLVVADLLDRSGPDGPEQDATIVCLDLA